MTLFKNCSRNFEVTCTVQTYRIFCEFFSRKKLTMVISKIYPGPSWFSCLLFLLLECNTNFWLANPYGLANQNLCYIQMFLNIEKSGERMTENVLKNNWWIRTQGYENFTQHFSFQKQLSIHRTSSSKLQSMISTVLLGSTREIDIKD